MELTRRTFGKLLLGAAAAVLTGVWGVAQRLAPVRFVRAIKARQFPGRLRPFDEAAARRRGKWRG